MRLHVLALFLLIALSSTFARAEEKDQCVSGDHTITQEVLGFSVTISRYHDISLPAEFQECRAVVRDHQKHVAFSVHESCLAVVLAGQDVNGDGIPDMVLEGDSGGMHGTKTYYLLSLGNKPRLILQFQTEGVPAQFVRNPTSGAMEIHTWDGAFFSFDQMANSFSPYPDIYFQVQGATLKDVSQHHRAEYDRAIRQVKMKMGLSAEDFARFRVIDESWEKAGEEVPASAVLQIAVLYLYSGRELRAHQTIQQMWPAWDQPRIWKLILETRRLGLSQFSNHRILWSHGRNKEHSGI
jgi:hypothetical protein